METELKPCPFCGGKPDVRKEYPINNHFPLNEQDVRKPIIYIGCVHCGISVNYNMEFWNTRPAEDALKAEVERLKSLGNELYNFTFVTQKVFEAILEEHEEDFFNDYLIKCIKVLYKARMEYGIKGVCEKCEDFDCCNCDAQKAFVKVFGNAPDISGERGRG